MTREEKIIATAFTGKMFIDGSEMGSLYEYMEKKVGHGVIDLMLARKEFWEELHKACEQDFIDMVSKEQPSLPSNLDEAAKEYAENAAYGEPDRVFTASMLGFKDGAEWMAGQGITLEGRASRKYENGLAGFVSWVLFDQQKAAHLLVNQGEEADVIINIRKK